MQVCEVVAMYVPTTDYKVNDLWQEHNRNFAIGMWLSNQITTPSAVDELYVLTQPVGIWSPSVV